jgi:cobalt-zinc-cadmium resistance protein CzcA
MVSHLIQLAFKVRWLVLLMTALVIVGGIYSFTQQPIDAYPDISELMVQVITTYPGRAAEEVEKQVTIPVEIAMRNVPRVEVIRSRTIFGLSVVQMIFESGTELYWARQRVNEKLNGVTLPPGTNSDMGPPNTAFDEIYRYELVSDGTHSLLELRELNDWVVVPRLLRCSGVSDVSNFGGLGKQFGITFRPADLARYGLSVNDVADAVRANNAVAGGSVIQRGSMSFVIRSTGALENLRQIDNIFVKSVGGTPIYLRDVASATLEARPPDGIFSRDKIDDGVEGIVLMRRGENPSRVIANVEEAIAELNKENMLPPGLVIKPYYNRQELVDNTLHTVGHSVALGVTLVVLVLLFFLGRPSMAGLVALTIPFSLLFALILMYATGIPIGLLSIGAIDFGIIVDGAIIVAENIARRLGEKQHRGEPFSVPQTVLAAALEMERPVFYSVLMIVIAYLPLLSLTRIEGLLFRPMAVTMVYALGGALLFALFSVPVLATYLFRHGYHEWENPLLAAARWCYHHVIRACLAMRWFVVAGAISIFAFVMVRFGLRLGVEFLPYMDEGNIYIRASFPEGTSLQQTAEFAKRFRQILLEYPEVLTVAAQSGRNDSGTDPFPPNRLEVMVVPKLQAHWREQFHTKQELLADLRQRFRHEFPTTRFNFTQLMIDNVLEDTNGTSANLAIEFSGPNPEILHELAQKTVEMLKTVPGAVDVAIEQEGPQPQLSIHPDRALCARYNIKIEDVTKLINTALGGDSLGTVYEGDRRFDIVAKFDRQAVNSAQAIGRMPVYNADGLSVPLSQVAKIEVVDGQTLIARENSKRRITVRTDIVGRDQQGFVLDAQRHFEEHLASEVPQGYRVNWIGMFDNMKHALRHFMILIPITVVLVFGMLMWTLRSVRAGLVVITAVPFALVGGVVALYYRGMNLNVAAAVGFSALFGLAVMDGVLMVQRITNLRQLGMEFIPAIIQGANDRLRPVLMTSIVAIFGLLPASLATGLGSDVQRPLATVIVWGLFSSTVLTLFVVPVLYEVFHPSVPPLAEHEQEMLIS